MSSMLGKYYENILLECRSFLSYAKPQYSNYIFCIFSIIFLILESNMQYSNLFENIYIHSDMYSTQKVKKKIPCVVSRDDFIQDKFI